jgi:hypothetical protein
VTELWHLCVVVSCIVWANPIDRDLEQAINRFHEAMDPSENSESARLKFRQAAELAARVKGGSALRRLEGHAALLAGDLPHAIEAYRLGLMLDPDDTTTRQALDLARSQVDYATPEERRQLETAFPDEFLGRRWLRRWGTLMAGVVSTLAAVVWLCGKTIHRLVLAAMLESIALFIGGAWYFDRHDRLVNQPTSLVVIRTPTWLRTGNHEEFPPRRDHLLPAGVEARLLSRHEDWVRVELADGTIGWIPALQARIASDR